MKGKGRKEKKKEREKKKMGTHQKDDAFKKTDPE